jgi:hypothetical protein
MVKKFLSVLALVAAVGTLTAAQEVKRPRWAALFDPAETIRVTITSPTLEPKYRVSTETVVLRGVTKSTDAAPMGTVSWNNITTATSGDATLGAGGTFETSAAPESIIVGHDTFSAVSAIPLNTTVADIVGGAWTSVINTVSPLNISRRSVDYIQPSSSNTTAVSPRLVDILTPSAPITDDDYDVEAQLVHDSGVGAAAGAAIVFGYQDTSNYCVALIYGSSASPDAYLLKRVAGALSVLGSADVNHVTGDTYKVEARGQALTLKRNENTVIEANDTVGAFTCDDANGVGVGFGAFRDVTTDDVTTATKLDNFKVTDQGGGGTSLTLAPGDNEIVITACDTQAVPVCVEDTIHIFYETEDTVPPVISISSPVVADDYNAPSAIVSISGSISDNTGVDTVVYSCSGATSISTTSASTTTSTFSAQVTVNVGDTTCVFIASDEAANQDDDTIIIHYQPGDTTIPTITITTSGPIFNTTGQVNIQGTAADTGGSGLDRVTWTCDTCNNGVATGTNPWFATVNLVLGDNNITFSSFDLAQNQSTPATILVNYNPPSLTITTVSVPNGRVGTAYNNTTIQASGGTTPYTWDNNAGGTSLGASACSGLSISTAGVISGTPTTQGTCNTTVRVTDSSGGSCPGSKCDTQALSFTIAAAGAEGPHDYFDSLRALGSCNKAFSFRPLTGQTTPITDCSSPRYEKQLIADTQGGYREGETTTPSVTYCPTGAEYAPSCNYGADTDLQKQDAAKLQLKLWTADAGLLLASDVDDTQTNIPFNIPANIIDGAGIKIDNEIMLYPQLPGGSFSSSNPQVERGKFFPGSNTSHTAGTTIYKNTNINTIKNHLYLPINTNGTEDATYVFTWDTYYTDSFISNKHGLQVHKTFKWIATSNTDDWFRADGAYRPDSPDTDFLGSTFDRTRDVGFVRGRKLPDPTHQVLAGDGSLDPRSGIYLEAHKAMNPIANGSSPIIKPNVWGRWWVQIDTKTEGDPDNFTDTTIITQAVGSAATDDRIFISCPASPSFGPGCSAFTGINVTAGSDSKGSWPGRSIKIDDEIMTLVKPVSTISNPVRELQVLRGQYGTTIASHAANARVGVVMDDVSFWYADENQEPMQILDRWPNVISLNSSTVAARGALRTLIVEYSTSTDIIFEERIIAGQQDLVVYLRNMIFLKNPPADWTDTYLVKPVR